MSDNIPFEIQTEIMKSLPLKSLMRFRSVCKQWISMIDSSRFVSDYNLRHTQPHLFIVYQDPREDGLKYVSIVDDDDNFPEQICDMTAIIPNSIKELFVPNKWMGPLLVGSCQGLLCFYGCSRVVIWNPWIRKSVDFTVPKVDYIGSTVGFGVCPKTSDPKFVKITFSGKSLLMKTTWEVEIFSLSLGFWISRSFSKINNLLCQSLDVMWSSECVDGFIYWPGFNTDDGIWVLISFDVTNEEFGVIPLPDSFKCFNQNNQMKVLKHRESLVLLIQDFNIVEYNCDVWIMERGDTKSFKKLLNLNSKDKYVKTMAISYNGEAILERKENYREENLTSIYTYEPSFKRFKYTSINGIPRFTAMSSYMETMLLHDYKEFNVTIG